MNSSPLSNFLTLGMAVVLGMGGASAFADLKEVSVKVAYARGTVTDGEGKALKAGDQVKAGEIVRTGADGVADLTWLSGSGGGTFGSSLTRSVIRVDRSSELKIDKMVQYDFSENPEMPPLTVSKMNLKEGTIFANIKKSSNGKFEVKTVNSVADIRGTAFKLGNSGSITVLEGEVSNQLLLPNGKKVEITVQQGSKLVVTPKMLSALAANPDDGINDLKAVMKVDAPFQELKKDVEIFLDSSDKSTKRVEVGGQTVVTSDTKPVISAFDSASTPPGSTEADTKKKKKKKKK